ncbi:hypothetical protein [Nakamurella endophytica]|uniref:DUF5709 domain-containing protein n=1 Tax=Nakamurella endophytica TaxID=1748367 RepID=A0A917SSS6_9ACTN|nr:hypothetical protein [Nakamurella endophytica]GGL97233.1 hypothetical protein GCM10011594_16160 [Nakamurella endophytica]
MTETNTGGEDSLARAAAQGPINHGDDAADETYSAPAEAHDSNGAADELAASDPDAGYEGDGSGLRDDAPSAGVAQDVENPQLSTIYGQSAAQRQENDR